MIQITEAVKHLIIINVILFLASMSILGDYKYYLYMFYPESPMYRPWQFITHMFMHGSFYHIFFNMMTLLFIGPLMETDLGTKRFLLYYFGCGLGGAILHIVSKFISIHYFNNLDEINIPVIGASGAINGLFVGLAYLYPNLPMNIMFFPVPIKAKYIAIFFLGADLFLGLSGSHTGIAHYAHLGGALFGLLMLMYWRRR